MPKVSATDVYVGSGLRGPTTEDIELPEIQVECKHQPYGFLYSGVGQTETLLIGDDLLVVTPGFPTVRFVGFRNMRYEPVVFDPIAGASVEEIKTQEKTECPK